MYKSRNVTGGLMATRCYEQMLWCCFDQNKEQLWKGTTILQIRKYQLIQIRVVLLWVDNMMLVRPVLIGLEVGPRPTTIVAKIEKWKSISVKDEMRTSRRDAQVKWLWETGWIIVVFMLSAACWCSGVSACEGAAGERLWWLWWVKTSAPSTCRLSPTLGRNQPTSRAKQSSCSI